MKRDFELEFKELKLNEVPDLWNRIESGLSERNLSSSVSSNTPAVSNVYKFAKRPKWRKWGTLAAACLCIAVIFPALTFVIGNMGGRKNSYSGSALNDADGATADVASNDMENTPESTTNNEMNGSAENISEGRNMTNMSEMAAESETAYASYDAAESETTGMSDVEESANDVDSIDSKESLQSAVELDSTRKSQSADNAGTADASASKTEKAMRDSAEDADDSITNGYTSTLDLEDGQVLKDLVVEIMESSVSGKDTVYKAVVKQQDEGRFLSTGIELIIVCNSDTQYGFSVEHNTKNILKEKERYEVTLRYEKNKIIQSAESGGFVAIIVGYCD